MSNIKPEIQQWQEKIENLANSIPEDEICPKCNVNILQGLQKVCSVCYEDDRFENRKKEIAETIADVLREKGVGKRHLECSFDNFEVGENVKCVEFLKSINRKLTDFILLYSPTPGTGKTHLATATLRRILLSGYEDVLFVTSPDIFLEIKNSYDGNSDTSEKRVIDKYCRVHFLVIDDIGVERVTDWLLQIWYMILSRREVEMKPTLFTSNLTLGQIKDTLGSRISSRMSGGYVFEIKGDDYRLKSRKKICKKM